MVRNFSSRPLPDGVLDEVLDCGRRAPSAGNSQGFDFVVLEGSEETARYWDATLPPERRSGFRWPGLLDAPALVVVVANRQAYLDRYSEPDKASTGLSEPDAWPVPFWLVDAGFATMLMLLAAVDLGLGALFFGIFRGRAELTRVLAIPPDRVPVGTLAIGYSEPDDAGRSAGRGRRSLESVVHRGRFRAE